MAKKFKQIVEERIQELQENISQGQINDHKLIQKTLQTNLELLNFLKLVDKKY